MSGHQVPPGIYLQPVPDHCDRITWRGQCLSLDHIVGASRSDKAELLSQLKVVQFHMIRGDFDGNKRLQREAIAAMQKTIDAAEAAAKTITSQGSQP
jgi:hypothetical protein